ncbi:MAG: hypothetical protein H0X65_19790 [Gemmatimonadetes bacterium]|nr:hypothetical protein [Gemmatimonadota bacterium]
MAERNQQVLDFVRQELEKEPNLPSRPLYDQAQEIDPSIGNLSPNQFQGSYFLPIKRERSARAKKAGEAPASGAKRKKSSTPQRRTGAAPESAAAPESRAQQAGERALDPRQVRNVFLQFARDFAVAESRSEIVEMLSKVDDYVDQVVKQGR